MRLIAASSWISSWIRQHPLLLDELLDPITTSLEIPDGSFNISAHYWSQATYERLLQEAGFQKIVWHPMEVPEDAIQRYGQDYWQAFQTKSLDIVLECYKPSEAG